MTILVNGGIGGGVASVPDGTTVYPVAGVLNSSGRTYSLIAADGLLPLPAVNSVTQYGAKCDGQVVYDANITGANAAAMTIASTTARFTAADVGKSCVQSPKTATGNFSRFGFITQVIDANTVIANLSGITTGTGQQFVWGTDDTTAVNLALSTAFTLKQTVFIPSGICTCTGQITVPTGVTLMGIAQATGVGFARDFEYYNSCLVLTGFTGAQGGFVKLGNNGVGNSGTNSGTRGSNVRNLTIDAMNNAASAVGSDSGTNFTRACHIVDCTLVRGTSSTLSTSPSALVDRCTIINQQRGNGVTLLGDSKITNCWVYGSGAGFAGIKSLGTDATIYGNHIWKDSDTPTATGPAILIDISGGNTSSPSRGGITVANNAFDTSFGPHIQVTVAANTYVRSITVTGNIGFANDLVPNATYPYMALTVGAGASIRALTVTGNSGQGSWNDNTKGQLTALIDGSGITGTVIASSVIGNVVDNCAALYATFTPTFTSGNHVIPGAVATVVITG